MKKRLLITLAAVTLPWLATAQPVQPVPGSGAAYLYFPDSGDNRSILKVVKEGGIGLAQNYEVHYTFDGTQELLCAQTDLDCEKTLAQGTVKLHIKGDWAENNTSVTLPMSGKFSGACSATDTQCQFALQAGASHTVRIKVGCNAEDYSVVQLGNNDVALCVGPSIDGNNKILFAAHKNTQPGLRPKNKEEQWGNNSNDDGIGNTQTILNAWTASTDDSAAHYCKDLSIGSGSSKLMQWYLPARAELKLALKSWDGDAPVITRLEKPGYYSSTEESKKKTKTVYWKSSGGTKDDDVKYDENDGTTLCMIGIQP